MPFIRSILNNQRHRVSKPLPHFGAVKVDLHSHLIPGIDDGAQSLNESITLIKSLIDLGFEKVITTPHIRREYYPNSISTINRAADQLRSSLEINYINLEVEVAAEYYLDTHFWQLLKKNEILTFGDNQLLFELSHNNKPQTLEYIIGMMLEKGYKPVLAHPERYPYFAKKGIERFHRLKELGVEFQMNLMSLSGLYSPLVKKTAQMLIDANLIDYLGSDLHRENQLPYLKKVLGERHLQKALSLGIANNKLL